MLLCHSEVKFPKLEEMFTDENLCIRWLRIGCGKIDQEFIKLISHDGPEFGDFFGLMRTVKISRDETSKYLDR